MAIPRYIRNAWNHMRHRCYNANAWNYQWYGARGIQMCDRWRSSCEAFYADMGDRPTPKHSVDRIDNEGDYTPENCRWATTKQQRQNTRSVRMLTHNGKTMCLTEWARRVGISPTSMRLRLKHMSVERAVTTPPQESGWQGCITKRQQGTCWKKKASKFIGVGKQQRGWQASLKKDGVVVYRKYFKTQIKAALAYDAAVYEHYGVDGRFNFPEKYRP